MAAIAQKKQFALDSNILYDLSKGEDFAHTFREVSLEKGYDLSITPTVVQELTFALKQTGNDNCLALRALRCMRSWGIRPFDLMPVGHAITEQFARLLQNRQLLPPEEVNDGQILAETSLAGIPVLVTSDHHLLDIEETQLEKAFSDSSLDSVKVAHPKGIIRVLR